MRVVQINTACGVGSTGKICVDISKLLTQNGVENYILYSGAGIDYPLGINYANENQIRLGAIESRIRGNWGFENKKSTKNLIARLEKIKPDIVHLHNIHSHACNLEILINYLKSNNIKVVWTFHDCWPFTGYCMHYDMIGCDKWKTECFKCPQKNNFSWIYDRSRSLYNKKKQLFSDMNLTVVTPSKWLAQQVKNSFLKDCAVKVINNGIDLTVFKPVAGDFREKYNCKNKSIVLGVSFGWSNKKGIDVFVALSNRLLDSYQIVLVGTDKEIDEKLPKNIISIHRTQSQQELAHIYSSADVFVNPTREENYPTVNMESIACSTPVVTFDTGGSAEIIDKTCGISVAKNDVDALCEQIVRVCNNNPYSQKDCLEAAKFFDKNIKYNEYLKLYQSL